MTAAVVANRVQMSVSGTPGTGTITLGAASSGYQSLASAFGADTTIDILSADGTAWEVARNCAYNHVGNTVTRGTLEDSSTGSAISLSSSAIVSVIASADRTRQWISAALEHSTVSGTSGGITAEVNTLYVADMSGWTADRTLTLPATAAVGDRVGVMVTTGDDAYEWLITAASGDTLNGVAGGTEWSRVFITGEVVIFRCVAASATWIVEYDGRLPAAVSVRNDDTTTQSIGATTFVKLQAALDAEDWDNGDSWDNSAGSFTARRTGAYTVSGHCQLNGLASGASLIVSIRVNGTDHAFLGRAYSASSGAHPGAGGSMTIHLTTGDTVELYVYNSGATSYNTWAGAERVGFSVAEVL